jgi:hypothetical protein
MFQIVTNNAKKFKPPWWNLIAIYACAPALFIVQQVEQWKMHFIIGLSQVFFRCFKLYRFFLTKLWQLLYW